MKRKRWPRSKHLSPGRVRRRWKLVQKRVQPHINEGFMGWLGQPSALLGLCEVVDG